MSTHWAIACCLLVGCAHDAASEPAPEAPLKVRCVAPMRQSLDEQLELNGHLEPPPGEDLPLASQVAGRVLEVLVREGQSVAAGDTIASVDDVASRAAARQAEAALAQAKASAGNAKATLARVQALVDRGIAAQQELDDANAKAETENQGVSSANAALESARRTLGRVQVRAPFGGVITRVWRGAGALVDGSESTPIAQLAATSGAEFVADTIERDLPRISVEQAAQVSIEGAPALSGKVRAVARSIDSATGLATVRIRLAEPPSRLAMGTHGLVHIVTAHRESVLLLPHEALRGAVSDGAEVVICRGGEASVIAVQVGYRDSARFEVSGGLPEQAKVAIEHVLGLENGTKLSEQP